MTDNIHSVQGRWEAADPANAFLDFGPILTEDGAAFGGYAGEGTLRGSDGCNGVAGWYTVDGDTATIRRGLNTLKACIGVDTWLAATASVRVDGDVLTVLNGSGEQIGTLTRCASSQ